VRPKAKANGVSDGSKKMTYILMSKDVLAIGTDGKETRLTWITAREERMFTPGGVILRGTVDFDGSPAPAEAEDEEVQISLFSSVHDENLRVAMGVMASLVAQGAREARQKFLYSGADALMYIEDTIQKIGEDTFVFGFRENEAAQAALDAGYSATDEFGWPALRKRRANSSLNSPSQTKWQNLTALEKACVVPLKFELVKWSGTAALASFRREIGSYAPENCERIVHGHESGLARLVGTSWLIEPTGEGYHLLNQNSDQRAFLSYSGDMDNFLKHEVLPSCLKGIGPEDWLNLGHY
jgi:hypothetical protein